MTLCLPWLWATWIQWNQVRHIVPDMFWKQWEGAARDRNNRQVLLWTLDRVLSDRVGLSSFGVFKVTVSIPARTIPKTAVSVCGFGRPLSVTHVSLSPILKRKKKLEYSNSCNFNVRRFLFHARNLIFPWICIVFSHLYIRDVFLVYCSIQLVPRWISSETVKFYL